MIKSLPHQAIALAGLTQAVHLVQQLAKSGTADSEEMESSLASLLKLDADDVEDVYDGLDKLKTGLRLLERQLGSPNNIDPDIARYVASLIFLERKLNRSLPMKDLIRDRIMKATAQVAHFGIQHENVIARFADIYQETISQLRPRVMVMGEPMHLTNQTNANRTRALLLAGIRSAVLWRQCGGSRWRLLFFRSQMLEETIKLRKRLQ